jgi:hypothetical protein
MFQSLGIAHPRNSVTLKNSARVIATLIFIGYAAIPVSVLLGFVK